ncbi:MAG: GGDEF domain-containing protein [Clostridiales bacterium]|nr:GGDEF domain-containing protein [Clostridiales bacterium]
MLRKRLYRGFHDSIVTLNVERISVVSFCAILFQFVGLLDNRFSSYEYLYIGCVLVIAICVIFMFMVKIVLENIKASNRFLKGFYMAFWILLCAGMYPFYYIDVVSTGQPLYSLIFCGVFIIAPVFTVVESSIVFAVYMAVNMLAASVGEAQWTYYLYIGTLAIAGFLFSYYGQNQYISLIRHLETETNQDFLTGILNRRAGYERSKIMLELCKRHQEVCGIIIADIDHFKDYNDTYGHYEGDEVLVKVARCIEGCFSRVSDVVFRYGGEEFVMCISVAKEEDILMMAEKVRRSVEEMEIKVPNTDVSNYLTISVGVASYLPEEDVGIMESELIQCADRELYKAKASTRNTVYYRGESLEARKSRTGN